MAELSDGFILWRSPCCYICVSLHLHPPPSPPASRGADIAVQLSTALFPRCLRISPGVVSYVVAAPHSEPSLPVYIADHVSPPQA